MTNELFIPIKFNTSVQLKPNELCKNIDEILFSKLKGNLENVCSKHGYIKKNSIKIIKRSIGKLVIPQFNGNVHFDLQCVGEICNPAQGSIIKCTVKAKNSLGLLAEGFHDNIPILQIIVPKISAGFQSEIDIDSVNVGEQIKIEVCGKKFMLYDKHISLIGKAIQDRDENIQNVFEPGSEIDDDKNTEDNDNMTINGVGDFDDEKSEIYGTNDDENEDKDDVDDDEVDEDEVEDEEDDEIDEDDISLGEELPDDDIEPDEPFLDDD
jgi:DNA-directed RNA polymerase subunit E'/Rpb7